MTITTKPVQKAHVSLKAVVSKGLVPSTKRCGECKVVKSSSGFSRNKCRNDGLGSSCKQCDKVRNRERRNTEDGFFRMIWDSAKLSTKSRNAKGRDHEFTLTLPQVKAKWATQRGLCAITSMQMSCKSHSHFKCSIERIDNDIGYTDSNCILVCTEANTPHVQWNLGKAEYLFSIQIHNPIDLTSALQRGATMPTSIVNKWTVDKDGTVFCYYCDTVKMRNEFGTKLSCGCKACVTARLKAHSNTWRGALQTLYNSAKANTRRRGMKFMLKYNELEQILISQGGLCYYSGKPMSPAMGDYKVSLERLNVRDTYTVTNSVLICMEFNSADHTRRKTEHSNEGNSGWSKEKFAQVQKVFNAGRAGRAATA